MSEVKELTKKAKALITSSPKEATLLYKKVWEEHAQDYNAWDAVFTLKAIRKCSSFDLKFVDNIIGRFSKDEKVKGIYGWLVFDNFVKGKSKAQLLEQERRIAYMCKIVPQRDSTAEKSYPCPVAISVFKMIDAHTENLFNEKKVNEWLAKINPELLSAKEQTINTEQRGEVKIASDFEKYYALKTKALLKMGAYEKCKKFCTDALTRINPFHYNNDLWLKMRIAICEEKLGNTDASEAMFKDLLQTKAGSDKWFIYRDIAKLYYNQGNYQKAWKAAVDAAFYGNEPHFLVNLYLLQARILFNLERAEEGKILASLIAAILKEQKWKSKEEHDRLFKHYNLEPKETDRVSTLFRKAKVFWIQERYKDLKEEKGKIVFIHRNNKFGKVKTAKGKVYDFHRRDLMQRERNLQALLGRRATFIAMSSFNGQLIAERIILEKETQKKKSEIVGQILEGRVSSIVDFGMFICFEKHKDGLLHRNDLPRDLKNSFPSRFSRGDKVKVRILAESPKGLDLQLI